MGAARSCPFVPVTATLFPPAPCCCEVPCPEEHPGAPPQPHLCRPVPFGQAAALLCEAREFSGDGEGACPLPATCSLLLSLAFHKPAPGKCLSGDVSSACGVLAPLMRNSPGVERPNILVRVPWAGLSGAAAGNGVAGGRRAWLWRGPPPEDDWTPRGG